MFRANNCFWIILENCKSSFSVPFWAPSEIHKNKSFHCHFYFLSKRKQMTRGSSQGKEVGRRLYFRERDEYSAGHNSQCTCSAGGARAHIQQQRERERARAEDTHTHTQGREKYLWFLQKSSLRFNCGINCSKSALRNSDPIYWNKSFAASRERRVSAFVKHTALARRKRKREP
jgi:hypothetical protein